MPVFLTTAFGLVWHLITGNANGLLQTALNYWSHKTDVNLAEVQAALPSAEHVAIAALNANVQASAIQADMAKTILNDPMARFFVGLLIGVTVMRFCLIVFDSTWWWMWGCDPSSLIPASSAKWVYGEKCSWSIPAIRGLYGGAEMQILLFWIIAKPVDSAIQGVMATVNAVIRKKSA